MGVIDYFKSKLDFKYCLAIGFALVRLWPKLFALRATIKEARFSDISITQVLGLPILLYVLWIVWVKVLNQCAVRHHYGN